MRQSSIAALRDVEEPIGRTPAERPAVLPVRSLWKRRTAMYSRWLHIYISMFSCAVVLFFAVTGVTLNHPEWVAGVERLRDLTGSMNPAWTNTGTSDVARLDVVEHLRQAHGLSGAVSDVRLDEGSVSVSFKGPGYTADAVIDRPTGRYEITESRMGLVAIANDLHKGRDSGTAWKGVIDLSAIFLALVALTGLVLLYFVHKHRSAGFVLLGVGGLLVYGMYLAWTP